jgi:hypothetical protein
MAEERRPEGAQQRREGSPGAVDPGDAVPPGMGAEPGGGEEGDNRPGSERDPGDAVPPGVAPLEPPEPTEEDLRVLEKLRDLPRRS